MIITTSQGFNIIRILNKLGMTDEIVEVITDLGELNIKEEQIYIKLGEIIKSENEDYTELCDEDKSNITNKTLIEHVELAKELSEINSRRTKKGAKLMLDGITRLPQAEKEVYKCLAEIYELSEKEVRDKDLDWAIDRVKEIAQSETMQKVFSLATR
ncbi:hypothetical protein [Inconstantimicrobium mannanitabidum]|uniref:Uncharacterized protein n=1 Tax=Inconstantimicrobium mannanitabidum TaxID=1604901 RepID=A0ACB5R9X1_9CLOT|nr:hypothetical protein [Clostridium sp. TW13]GKX65837.1 hypothetical protein rsdtw13_10950 [Clostridium sp. TW13]